MELLESKPINSYVDLHAPLALPWHLRHKRTLFITLTVIGVALVIVIISVSVRCVTCAIGSPSSEYLVDSQSLIWDGTCGTEGSHCLDNSQKEPPLLIISLDGFRADYLGRGLTPTLSKIAKCGAKAEYMFPVYPSKTFPNHYSMVTGLYPSWHGIIDNSMYDSSLGKLFKVGRTPLDDPRWWQREPIWVSAQKQGKKAATFFWPGSDVRINGFFPNIYRTFNKSTPMEARVDEVVEWLSSSTRADFVTLYFEEPDSAAHAFGPNSQQVNNALKRVDGLLNRLLAGLHSRNLTDCVNILLVSDHGMSELDCGRVIDIRKDINVTNVHSFLGAFGRVKPKGNSTSTDELVSSLQCRDRHLRAYAKEELPVRMHYVDNERIEPVILDTDSGYQLVDQNVTSKPWKCTGGTHGYDNIFPDMRAIFFAYGPSFKRNVTVPPFLNIELYELMCEVTGIEPQPNNGTRGSLHPLLKQPPTLERQRPPPSPPVAEAPADKVVIQSRVDLSNCSCFHIPEPEDDASLIENRTKFHLPFGIPVSPYDGDSVLLYNNDYIVAYDKKYHFPRWTGFTINEIKNASEVTLCWSSDVRIENATCSRAPEGFTRRPLYPPQFSEVQKERQGHHVTNSILKSLNHTTLLEQAMIDLMVKYSSKNGPLNLMSGPAFSNRRSDASSPVPTHIFVLLTWCSGPVTELGHCNPELLDTVSFLLPNFPYPDNCESSEDTIRKNVARVADIEQMTGFTFYTYLDTMEAVRLRTSMSHHSF